MTEIQGNSWTGREGRAAPGELDLGEAGLQHRPGLSAQAGKRRPPRRTTTDEIRVRSPDSSKSALLPHVILKNGKRVSGYEASVGHFTLPLGLRQ